MAYAQTALIHLHDLADRLAASAVRIANYEHRLQADTATMRPIYLERLLDDYRAEIIRHDRLERELKSLEGPKPHQASKEYHRRYNKEMRGKIKY